MSYSRQQLISALHNEFQNLCHDDPYNPEDPYDMTPFEYYNFLNTLSVEQLIDETDTGDGYTLDEYIANNS